jgi:hypothetical protein
MMIKQEIASVKILETQHSPHSQLGVSHAEIRKGAQKYK